MLEVDLQHTMSPEKRSHSPVVVATLLERNTLVDRVHESIDGITWIPDLKNHLAGACLHLALEHGLSINFLVERNLVGSALGLVRVMLEAYVRGIWLLHSANDKEIQNFRDDRHIPGLATLLARMELVEGFDVGTLLAIKDQLNVLHALTHTGYIQVVRRLTEDEITSEYEDGEIVQLVDFAAALTCCTAISVCTMANRNDIANRILEYAKSLSAQP